MTLLVCPQLSWDKFGVLYATVCAQDPCNPSPIRIALSAACVFIVCLRNRLSSVTQRCNMAGPARLTAASCMVLCLVGLVSANVPISNPTSTSCISAYCAYRCKCRLFDSRTNVNLTIISVAALTSLQTVFGVTVSFMIDGQTIPANTSCVTGTYNAPCLTSLDADNPNTKAVINYQLLSNATLESTAHVILKVCYSAPSAKDRAWRKANNVIVVSPPFCPTIKLSCRLYVCTAATQVFTAVSKLLILLDCLTLSDASRRHSNHFI